MLRVGLTGNVASGKSTVLRLFKQWGASVIDHDVLARSVAEPGSPILDAIAKRFPGVLRDDGTLDREALRHRVFGHDTERAALNAIVHPAVARRAATQEALLVSLGVPLVVHDIPLLFEVLDPATFGAIVLVAAPAALRRQRLVRDRGLSPADADALIAAQMPSDVKRARSHFVIENGGDLEALEASARAVWSRLQERAGIA